MIEEVQKLTEYMKTAGILHLKCGDIEISLSPDALQAGERPKPEQKLDNTKRGRLGLTRQQEYDLFNEVFEDDFKGTD